METTFLSFTAKREGRHPQMVPGGVLLDRREESVLNSILQCVETSPSGLPCHSRIMKEFQ
jgi:hypothetical protein